jgi:hypothetical protein
MIRMTLWTYTTLTDTTRRDRVSHEELASFEWAEPSGAVGSLTRC